MQYALNEEQRAFDASLRRALADLPVAADRMVAGTAGEALPRFGAVAGLLAGLGVPGILVAEAQGGLGLGHVEAVTAAMAFGAAGLAFPGSELMLGAAVMGAAGHAGLGEVLAGAAVPTCALSDTRSGGAAGWQADGRFAARVIAPYAAQCRWLAIPVGEAAAALVDLAGPGVSVVPHPSPDLTQRFDLVSVALPAGACGRIGFALLDAQRLLGSGELAGAARDCLDRSVAYLGLRQQFGRLIAANQALRHIAATDLLRCDTMELGCRYAAWALDTRAADAGAWVRAARAQAAEDAPAVAEDAIQLHGGIGFTWEFGLHLPLRRVARLAAHFGSPGADQEALAALALRRAGVG